MDAELRTGQNVLIGKVEASALLSRGEADHFPGALEPHLLRLLRTLVAADAWRAACSRCWRRRAWCGLCAVLSENKIVT